MRYKSGFRWRRERSLAGMVPQTMKVGVVMVVVPKMEEEEEEGRREIRQR